MSIETEIVTLETKITAATDQHSRAQGAYDQSMARLKAEHGCETLAEADAKQAEYETEAKEHETKAQGYLDECRKLVDGGNA